MQGQLRDHIKAAPISQIIGSFITLQRRGQNLVCLCPFHADSNPSMTISDQRGTFRCWACQSGGDAISFVMDFKKLDFIEAMRECARILGLPDDELNREKKRNPRLELAFRVLNYANKLYLHVAGQRPMHFKQFLEERKLTPEAAAQFQVGYAPGTNLIVQQLEGIEGPQGEEARKMAREIDLVRVSEKTQRPYDFYRDRIVFPIHDHAGQVRGFSCRKVLPEQEPKFLNSKDSFVFHKGHILYGFFLAKNAIRQNDLVILAEGNMDVVMMHQHGFTHTVGTMGVALGESCLKLLASMTKNVVLAMDSDAAGMKAMSGINNAFMSVGILPKYLSFAPAKDPDEFLREHGRLALMERIEKSPRFVDHLIEGLIPSPIPETIDQKLRVMNEVFAVLTPLKEHLEATERIVATAKRLGLRSDEGSILDGYRAHLKGQEKPLASLVPKPQQPENREEDEFQAPLQQEVALRSPLSRVENGPLLPAERNFLKTIMTHPECVTEPQLHEILAYVSHPEVQQLILWLAKIYPEIDELEYATVLGDEVFSEQYGREVKGIASEALENHKLEPLNEKVLERLLKDLKVRMQLEQLRQKRKENTVLQEQCQTQEEARFYMQEIMRIDQELQLLKRP